MISNEVKDSEDTRDRLRCQVNLMKLQVVTLMKMMDDKMVEHTDEKIDFMGRLKQTKMKRQGTNTPRKEGELSSRNSNVGSRRASGSGLLPP